MVDTYYDRVGETTESTGLGEATLSGAIEAHLVFSARYASGDTFPYVRERGAEWEVGKGKYHGSRNSVSRETIYASSNSDATVNFSAGIQVIGVTMAKSMWDKLAFLDRDREVVAPIRTRRQTFGDVATATAQWSMSAGPGGFTITLTGSTIIANPIDTPSITAAEIIAGVATFVQDTTGSRVPSYQSAHKNTPTLSTSASAADVIAWVWDGTHVIWGAKVTK